LSVVLVILTLTGVVPSAAENSRSIVLLSRAETFARARLEAVAASVAVAPVAASAAVAPVAATAVAASVLTFNSSE
jgi:hypothetical protein